MKNPSIYILLFCFCIFTGCTKGFETMNINPNSPEDVPAYALLGQVIVQTATVNNNYLGGLYSQQFAQNTYVLEDIYSPTTNDQTAVWNNSYSIIIRNSLLIRDKARAVGDKNLEAISEILIVMAFHNLTDIFGDIPYSEANKIDSSIVTPTYDKQQDIYISLLNRLKIAADIINTSTTIQGDILYSGNMAKWKMLANSLRLRIALRMSNADENMSRSVFEEIRQNATSNPLILEKSNNAALKWVGSSPYFEPWHVVYRANNDNYAASLVMINQLVETSDPRLPYYATRAKATNTYVGAVNGPLQADVPNRDFVSRIGSFFTADPAGYTKLLTSAETWLSLAEAAERGWNVGIAAEEAYLNGIRNSIEYVGLSWNEVTLAPFLQNPEIAYQQGDVSGNLFKIHMQKWLALYLQGMQAWAENRRTDVPLLSPAPGTRFPRAHNRPPFRIQYPNTERDLNQQNYLKARETAGLLEEKDFFWGSQMWWDKRLNVY